jgi:hypothetical protein
LAINVILKDRHQETNLRIVNVIYDPINNTFLVLLTKPICYHCYVKCHINLGWEKEDL